MIEKYEDCPSGLGCKQIYWDYDEQHCSKCGYGSAEYYAKLVRIIAMHPYELVKEFHEKFNHPIAKEIINLDEQNGKTQGLISLRMELINEEFSELENAFSDNNEIEMLDALCDMIYVIYGMALAFGWDINAAFAEVHRSNMSKLGSDGKPIVRKDGKILKGPNYSPPNLAQFFKRRVR